jgi:hypothetical protein
MRPFTHHQREVDAALLDAVRDLSGQIDAVRRDRG